MPAVLFDCTEGQDRCACPVCDCVTDFGTRHVFDPKVVHSGTYLRSVLANRAWRAISSCSPTSYMSSTRSVKEARMLERRMVALAVSSPAAADSARGRIRNF